MKEHVPQLLPAPKGKTFRQEIDQEAEPFQQQILEIANQRTSSLNPSQRYLKYTTLDSRFHGNDIMLVAPNLNFEMTKTISFGIWATY